MDFGGISLPVPQTEESQGVTGSGNIPLGPCKKYFHIPRHFWQFNSEVCGDLKWRPKTGEFPKKIAIDWKPEYSHSSSSLGIWMGH